MDVVTTLCNQYLLQSELNNVLEYAECCFDGFSKLGSI